MLNKNKNVEPWHQTAPKLAWLTLDLSQFFMVCLLRCATGLLLVLPSVFGLPTAITLSWILPTGRLYSWRTATRAQLTWRRSPPLWTVTSTVCSGFRVSALCLWAPNSPPCFIYIPAFSPVFITRSIHSFPVTFTPVLSTLSATAAAPSSLVSPSLVCLSQCQTLAVTSSRFFSGVLFIACLPHFSL